MRRMASVGGVSCLQRGLVGPHTDLRPQRHVDLPAPRQLARRRRRRWGAGAGAGVPEVPAVLGGGGSGSRLHAGKAASKRMRVAPRNLRLEQSWYRGITRPAMQSPRSSGRPENTRFVRPAARVARRNSGGPEVGTSRRRIIPEFPNAGGGLLCLPKLSGGSHASAFDRSHRSRRRLVRGGEQAQRPDGIGDPHVTANVSKNCTITTAPVNFGAYDPVAANATARSTAPAPSRSPAQKGRRPRWA